jgi:PhnB protein
MSTTLSPYLMLQGNTREAMDFYKSIFGGKLDMDTFADVPNMEISEDQKDKIMHAMLTTDDNFTIMASDAMDDISIVPGTNITLTLNGSDKEKISKQFYGLGEGGKITTDLREEFWGDTFGQVTDKFGILWMVNITKE